jgi:FkbM family methyltransferase
VRHLPGNLRTPTRLALCPSYQGLLANNPCHNFALSGLSDPGQSNGVSKFTFVTMLSSLVGSIQRRLSKSPFAVRLAKKVQNQCRMIQGYSLCPSHHPGMNGEERLLHTIAPHLRNFVDVGANVGDWTHLLLTQRNDPLIKGYLFEPNPQLQPSLQARFGHCPELQIFIQALGCQAEERIFFLAQTSSEHASFHLNPDQISESISTKVNSLDNFACEHGLTFIDFMKIDTEGHEMDVLLGAVDKLTNRQIQIIQFEYGDGWRLAGHTLRHCWDFLHRFDFEVRLITPRGLLYFDPDSAGEFFMTSNFIAYQRSCEQWVNPLFI